MFEGIMAFFSPMIVNFRIQDLFDILIIGSLIYVLLIWFKNTTIRFVFVGIILLGAIYFLARLFNLYLTSMLLQGFFAILLIALVVIFQEEIRRFFERLATWGTLRKARRSDGGSGPYHLDMEKRGGTGRYQDRGLDRAAVQGPAGPSPQGRILS